MFRRRQQVTSLSHSGPLTATPPTLVVESSMDRTHNKHDDPSQKSSSFVLRYKASVTRQQRWMWTGLILACLTASVVSGRLDFILGDKLAETDTNHLMPLFIRATHRSEQAPVRKPPPLIYAKRTDQVKGEQPDFGLLHVQRRANPQGKAEFGRRLFIQDDLRYDQYRRKLLKRMDQESENDENFHPDELEYSACQRPAWRSMYYPVCNNFHEIDLERSTDDIVPNFDSTYFGHGSFRDAWMISNNYTGASLVLKTVRPRHDLDSHFLEMMRTDGLVMTALLESPRIVNIMGACSGSLAVEPVDSNPLHVWIPRYSATKYEVMPDIPGITLQGDVRSENNLTLIEKIDAAVEVAEAIADLVGYEGGVIVDDDLMPDQWLRKSNGQLVLSDFNRAFILDWNIEEQEYCKIHEKRRANYYDAPETDARSPNDDKINVYHLGGHIYAILTGLRVYPEFRLREARQRALNGELPYLDQAFRNGTAIERELVKIMERCWTYVPALRPDIFQVLEMLRNVQAMHRKRDLSLSKALD